MKARFGEVHQLFAPSPNGRNRRIFPVPAGSGEGPFTSDLPTFVIVQTDRRVHDLRPGRAPTPQCRELARYLRQKLSPAVRRGHQMLGTPHQCQRHSTELIL
jgi:hypothetical protein